MPLDYVQMRGLVENALSSAELTRNYDLEVLMDFYSCWRTQRREKDLLVGTKLIDAIALSSGIPLGVLEELLEDEKLTAKQLVQIGKNHTL